MDYYDRDYVTDGGYNGGRYRGPPASYDYYDRLPPVQYRQPAPLYRDGLPLREYRPNDAMYRRGDWVDRDRFIRSGGGGGRYRLDRYEHGGHGGSSSYRGYHGEDDYMQVGNSYVSSRAAVELYVPICCDKCERKLRKHLDYVDGVESVSVDQVRKKVVVFGHVNPTHVLHRARRDKPESEFWHGAYYR